MEQSLATTQIFNANCLEKMKDLDDKLSEDDKKDLTHVFPLLG